MAAPTFFHVDRSIGFLRNRIALFLATGHDRIAESVARPIEMSPVGDMPPRPEPTLLLTHEEATDLMNELWLAGVRPSANLAPLGDVESLRAHLADMKAVAWAALGKAGIKP